MIKIPNDVQISLQQDKKCLSLLWVPPLWHVFSTFVDELDAMSGHRFCNSFIMNWKERQIEKRQVKFDIQVTSEQLTEFYNTFEWPNLFEIGDNDED